MISYHFDEDLVEFLVVNNIMPRSQAQAFADALEMERTIDLKNVTDRDLEVTGYGSMKEHMRPIINYLRIYVRTRTTDLTPAAKISTLLHQMKQDIVDVYF
jgi:hypothetical protein